MPPSAIYRIELPYDQNIEARMGESGIIYGSKVEPHYTSSCHYSKVDTSTPDMDMRDCSWDVSSALREIATGSFICKYMLNIVSVCIGLNRMSSTIIVIFIIFSDNRYPGLLCL